jgi:putative transposase
VVRESLPEATVEEIRLYLQQRRALGRDIFRNMVKAKTQRFVAGRPAHGPRKQPAAADK